MKQVTSIVDSNKDLIFNSENIVPKTFLSASKDVANDRLLITDNHSLQIYACVPGDLSAPTVADLDALFTWFTEALDAGTTDVALQDQTTQPVITKMNRLINSTTLVAGVSKGDKTITLADGTGVAVGQYLVIFDPTSSRFTPFTITAWADPVATLDSPIDFDYPLGSFVDVGDTNLAVNGSVTPVTFGLRNSVGPVPVGVELSLDITSIHIACIAASAVDLSKFGDLAALTNGLVIRKRDGDYYNYFNLKSNFDMANQFDHWVPFAATKPSEGIDGFDSGVQLSGQGNVGVTIRLPLGEDLEVIVQDALQTLTKLEVIVRGHIVDP
jgi:hypothetical protein